jgi:hypothetical protein
MSGSRAVSRRDFVKTVASGALAMAWRLPSAQASEPTTKKSRVVLIRDLRALDTGGNPVPEVLGAMLDHAVAALLGSKDPRQAWRQLAEPGDVVGIKTNVWAYLQTPREVEGILKARVLTCGVQPKNIRIDDRGARETLSRCTALINVRPLRTHHWAGIGSCIKNYIMFVDDPAAYHPDLCSDLGAIWHLPVVKGKTRLNVLLLLTPQFYGKGPHGFDRRFTWPYRGLLVSRDPVAADRIGVHLLEAKRREHFKEERPLLPLAKHIIAADTRYHLGRSNLNEIELVKLGWSEGILV